ncbi:MAG: peptide ABC transporter substrate-binding protein, partial [Chloroflexaceae bacterium]|nr:peptide ABC transporter substrate-binding protein [Chloroflexaceae bacterium]
MERQRFSLWLSRLALVMILVFVAQLLAACGTGGTATQPGAGTTAQPGAGTAAQPGTGQATQPGTGQVSEADLAPPEQQVLRVRMVSDAETIDPALAENVSSETVIQQLFSNLTRIKPDLQPEGEVAESWQFNADNTQITFTLKETQWSDGQPVTANDFVYAWQRFLDPRTGSPYVSLISGLIAGSEELNSASATDTAAIEAARNNLGVRAVDERTLQVDFNQPTPFFPSIAALGSLAPVRQDVVEQGGERWTEVGTLVGNGPFVLRNRTPGTEIVLAPNPNYFEGPPTLQQLIFRVITDDATALANYRSDEIDINESVPPAEVPGIRNDPTFQDQILSGTRLSTYYYGFNTTQPPFDNAQVRQAIAAAIDRQTLVSQVLNNIPSPAGSFIPPGIAGHLTPEAAGDAAQSFNPERAKQLLAEAGFPNGEGFPEVRLAFNNCCSHDLIAQRVQADLQTHLGINITLDPRESATYFSEIRRNTPSMFRTGWNADYADPYNWGPLVFGPESDQNYGRWQNPDFTRLLQEAEAATSADQRAQLYQQAEQVLAQ